MKKAVMDIGTNSTRVLLAEVQQGDILYSEKQVEITRIGQNVDAGKILTLEGMKRTLSALRDFKQRALDFGAEGITCFATSAVRDAENKEEFLSLVREELDIEIEVLSGEEEAQVGFMGAILGMGVRKEPVMVVDIGGGSTELIIGNDTEILEKKSIDMGCVRFTEAYEEDLEAMRTAVRELLSKYTDVFVKHPVQKVIGIAGTITTIVAMEQGMEVYDPSKVQNYILKRQQIQDALDRLMNISLEERKNIKGLQPKRADIIHAGLVILLELMNSLHFDTMYVNDCDNLEGTLKKKV